MDTRYTILIAIILAAFASCEECPAYICNATLPEGKCLLPTLPSPVKKYEVRPCSSTQMCPIDFENEMVNELTCEDKPQETIKVYPGAACKEDMDCAAGLCKDGACLGVQENVKCEMNASCYYEFTCRKTKPEDEKSLCLKPQVEGGYCKDDSDCENTHGCYEEKCTKYFSFPDGTKMKGETAVKTLSFCQSGLQVKGECVGLMNYRDYTSACGPDKHCKYLDSQGNEVSLPENCECGYNPVGNRFCKIGNSEFNHTRYLNIKKELFVGNPNCHASERGVFCGKDMKEMKEEFKVKLRKYYSYKIWAEAGHKLSLADHPCTTLTMFPDLDHTKDEPEPYKQPKCAKYTCVTGKDNCAQSAWFGKGNITVDLMDKCKSNEYCSVGAKGPNIAFYLGKSVTGTCVPQNALITDFRFPGEECVKHEECVNTKSNPALGKCNFGHCNGFNVTETCADSSECWAGLFCNEETKKCEKQKSSGACKKTWECENHLACFDGTCQDKLYTQKAGEKIEGRTDISTIELLCEFAIEANGKCAYYNDTATAKPDPKTGLVKCEIGTECEYDYSPVELGKRKEWCQCGYNEDGQAYCPLSNGQKIDTWKKYFTAVKSTYKNKCHTLNRYNCYMTDESALSEVRNYDHKTINAHLFANSVKCAEKVLGSSFIQISTGIMALLALLLI